jgi:uncharacterized protein with NRDE domain
MCLILLALKAHPRYKLIFAANRDEYYDRPSEQARFLPDAPDMLAGRDGRGGGTWTGITSSGRIAALTNYRNPAANRPGAPSRGGLVPPYLLGRDAPGDFLGSVLRAGERYNGFNLLAGNLSEIYWASNRGGGVRRLEPGLHGLSNSLLDTPWPKVVRGKRMLASALSSPEGPSIEALLEILADRTVPPDEALPRTGVGLEWERVLSPVFIESPTYGTRSSTVIVVDRSDRVTFVERTHDRNIRGGRDVRVDFVAWAPVAGAFQTA